MKIGLPELVWYGNDDVGRRVSPGAYFLHLHIEDESTQSGDVEKVVFID